MDTIEKKLVDANKNGKFLEAVYNEYIADRKGDEALFSCIAELHNSGKINVIEEFGLLKSSDAETDLFMLKHVLEGVIALISAPVPDIMLCIKNITLEAGQDTTAYSLISPFIEFCKKDPARLDEVLTLALDEVDIDYICPAIIAGSQLNIKKYAKKSIDLAKSNNSVIAQRAIYSLGRIEYGEEKDLIQKAIDTIISVTKLSNDDVLLASSLKSIFYLFLQDKKHEAEALKLLNRFHEEAADVVIHSASEILMLEKGKIPLSIEDSLLKILTCVSPNNIRTLNNIDYGLEYILKRGDFINVIEFLEALFKKSDYKIRISQFDGVIREITGNKEDYLYPLVTRWFLSKKVILGRYCSDLFSDGSDKGTRLKVDSPQLKESSSEVYGFLARKACGWLFMQPVSAVSFIVSLLDLNSEIEVEDISDIVFDPLLISYPGSVRKYLESIVDGSSLKVKDFVAKLLLHLDECHAGIKYTDEIKELYPSEAHRNTYARYHSRLMNDSFKNARKNSFFGMFNESVLLYGNKSIHYVFHGEEKTRQEVPLQQFSHSIEFPSLQNLNPHGLDSMLRSFRLEGCVS